MRGFILLVFWAKCVSAQVWSRLPDFPGTRRDDGVAVVVGNNAYFGTGLQEGWSATINWYALDLTTHTWSQIPDMPHTTERQYACAFPGPNCFFVFGGDGIGGALNNLWKYDIASKTWTQMTPKPGGGIVAASCMPFGDRAIIACGRLQAAGSVNREVWEYAIGSDSWQKKNDIPFPGRWRASGAALHNYGYLLFGIDSLNAFRKELYRYDRNADTWTKVSDFPQVKGRAYAAMQGAAEKLFVFGGYDSTNVYYNDVWYYNDIVNLWSLANALPSKGRRGGMYCAANDNFYYTCGLDQGQNRLSETWMTDVPLSMEEDKTGKFGFQVFPVPVKDVLILKLPEQKDYSARIIDANGKEWMKTETFLGIETEIDLRSLGQGVYVLQLFSGGSLVGNKKIVKACNDWR